MTKKYLELEIFEDYEGWVYRFHKDAFMYTQSGFNSQKLAFETAKENDWAKQSTRPLRIIATDKVVKQLGLDMVDAVRSIIPESNLVAVPIGE